MHLLPPALAALIQVILIDIAMAGDNAIVIGLAAARVPKPDRRKVIVGGLAAAVVLRLVLAILTASILKHIGLMFAGGILLLWVAWRLYRDIHHANEDKIGAHAISFAHAKAPDALKVDHGDAPPASKSAPCSSTKPQEPLARNDVRRAIMQVAVADLSMSLDNVLAVAGAAMNHVWVLVVGLILSIALMGFAASMMARLLQRHPWISYAGLTIVVYVALRMIWFGGIAILNAM